MCRGRTVDLLAERCSRRSYCTRQEAKTTLMDLGGEDMHIVAVKEEDVEDGESWMRMIHCDDS